MILVKKTLKNLRIVGDIVKQTRALSHRGNKIGKNVYTEKSVNIYKSLLCHCSCTCNSTLGIHYRDTLTQMKK